MIISKIRIFNYKSFGYEKYNKMDFNNHINIIVGENNVGKSNIFSLINLFKKAFESNSLPINMIKKHELFLDGEFKPIILCKFEKKEIEDISNKLFGKDELKKEALSKKLSEEIKILLDINNDKIIPYIVFDELFIKSNGAYDLFKSTAHSVVKLNSLFMDDNDIDMNLLDYVELKLKVPSPFVIEEFSLIYQKIRNFFVDHVYLFNDIRVKPKWSSSNNITTFDGSELIDVLFNLKNHPQYKKRKMYDSICKTFNSIFPNLKIISVKANIHIVKTVDKKEIEIPLMECGTGLLEIIFFIANMIVLDDCYICIEEPENHLHPLAQRNLYNIIKNQNKHKFIIITHSPNFISLNDIYNIHYFKEENGITQIHNITKEILNENEVGRIFHNFSTSLTF